MAYQYEVRKLTTNGKPGDLITYLSLDESEFISTIGRPGTFNGTALKPYHDTTDRRLYPWFEPGAVALWVFHEPAPEENVALGPNYAWGGVIWEISGSSDDSTMSVTAEEFTSFYDRTILLDDFTGNNVDRSSVLLVKDLVNFYPFSVNMPFSQTPPGGGVITRPRWFRYEARNMGDLIRSLCTTGTGAADTMEFCQKIRHGGDSSVIPTVVDTAAYFHVGIPTVVTVPGNTVKLEYGPGSLNTCRKIEWQYSARQSITRLAVKGFGERGSQLYNHVYAVAGPNRGMIQMDDQIEDQNLRSQGAVDNWGAQVIRQRGLPVPSVKAWVPIDGNMVTPTALGLGDELFCRFYDTYFKWRGFLRVTGFGRHVSHGTAEFVVELSQAVSSVALLADTIP